MTLKWNEPALLEGADESDIIGRMWRRFGAGSLQQVHRLAGRSRRTFACTGDGGEQLIIRLADPEGSRFELETMVLDQVARAGIRVPEVLYTGVEATPTGTPTTVMVQERLSGVTLGTYAAEHSADEAYLALAHAGEILHQIHGVPAGGFGPLNDRFLPSLCGNEQRLGDWFIDALTPKIDAARTIAPEARPLLDHSFALLANHRPTFDASATGLLHGDFSPSNVLVDARGRVTGILDWEAVKSGPPEIDIGWWDCFFNTPELRTTALIDGYERHGNFDPDRLAALRHLVVIRVMIGHFTWTLSVGDHSGVRTAIDRLRIEVGGANAWSIS